MVLVAVVEAEDRPLYSLRAMSESTESLIKV